MSENEKTIAVDLDGVIFKYDGWKGIDYYGEPIEGVRKSLRYLKYSMGYRIEIYTNRLNKENNKGYSNTQLRRKVARALLKHKIPFDGIALAKPLAEFYIDDRAIRFKDWPGTIRFIKRNCGQQKTTW